jgi:Protein of unknown function (DUF3631)
MTNNPLADRQPASSEAWEASGWKEAAKDYASTCAARPRHYKRKRNGKVAADHTGGNGSGDPVDHGPPEDGNRLLDDVQAYLGRFVAYPSPEAQVAHTLWVAHTHLMPAWVSTPRIAFLSPEPGSGKTRALEVMEPLVPAPIMALNVSAAYLFRRVGHAGDNLPTILFDEIDTVFGPKASKDNEEVRAFLNTGHRRGAVFGRCVTHGKNVGWEDLPAYAALAVAGLGFLPDTLLDRCVVIRMRRRRSDETVKPFRLRQHGPAGHELRRRLVRWAARIVTSVTDVWPELPDGIEDRPADVWEALIAVADAAGGDWPQRARASAVTLVAAAREQQPSLGIWLLSSDLKGRPLDDRGLARWLAKYDIKPRLIRNGDQVLRGYNRADFYDAWARYCPAPLGGEGSVTSVTSVTPEPLKPQPVTAVTDVTVPQHREEATPFPVCEADPDPEDRTCHYCHKPPDGTEQEVVYGDLPMWLHPACQWPLMGRQDRPVSAPVTEEDDLGIPEFLRRT